MEKFRKLDNLSERIFNICSGNTNEIEIYADCGYGKEMRTTARDTIKHVSFLINDVLKIYIQNTNSRKELLVLSQLICRAKLTEQGSLDELVSIYVYTLDDIGYKGFFEDCKKEINNVKDNINHTIKVLKRLYKYTSEK